MWARVVMGSGPCTVAFLEREPEDGGNRWQAEVPRGYGLADIARLLEIGWQVACDTADPYVTRSGGRPTPFAHLERGRIRFLPDAVLRARCGRFTYRLAPERARRPRGRTDSGARPGLFTPHRPCPFCELAFAKRRAIVDVLIADRRYHVVANLYPVVEQHFVVSRARSAPPGELGQVLHGQHEIEDMLALLAALGPPARVFFNSSLGADGSSSGSSVHHFHFQLFGAAGEPDPELLESTASARSSPAGVSAGRVPGWPAHHTWVDGDGSCIAAAANAVWRLVEDVHRHLAAYNLYIVARPAGGYRVLVFARRLGPVHELPGGGRLEPGFGGCELAGELVTEDEAAFRWIRANLEAAAELTAQRLRETTRPITALEG